MKKKVILIAVSVIIIISVIIATILLKSPGFGNLSVAEDFVRPGMGTVGEALLKVDTKETIVNLVKEGNLESYEEGGHFYVYNSDLYENKFTFYYSINDAEEVKHITADAVICNLTADQGVSAFEEKCKNLISDFMVLFDYYSEVPFLIYDVSGNSLENVGSDEFQKIVEGKAYLSFSVNENENSYWEFTIKKRTDETINCLIEHYIDDESFKNTIGDVNISL